MNLTYENANMQDFECIYNFNKDLFDQYGDVENVDYEKLMEALHRKIEKTVGEYKRILYSGELAGYYRLCQKEYGMEIDDLYIFPEFQNQGIGTAVIEKCCAEAGLPIFLYVFIQNMRAFNLYERLGFYIIGATQGSVFFMRKDK